MNAIANICELAGADVTQVMKGMGLDPRIGSAFLSAGLGFGGSCFPKDTRALVKTAQDQGVPLRIVEAVLAVNETRKRAMLVWESSNHFASPLPAADVLVK